MQNLSFSQSKKYFKLRLGIDKLWD